MKKLLMFAALVAALASCQSNNKKTVQAEMADTTMDALPIMEVDEVFTGTIPAADGPGIDFVLTLGKRYGILRENEYGGSRNGTY